MIHKGKLRRLHAVSDGVIVDTLHGFMLFGITHSGVMVPSMPVVEEGMGFHRPVPAFLSFNGWSDPWM